MRVLALDIGARRTGVAIFEDDVGFVRPLPTLQSDSASSLVDGICVLATERSVDHLILGLPLLPSGDAGEQAMFVHGIADTLRERAWGVTCIDERYTTPRHSLSDGDAEAACEILKTFLTREGVDI